MRRFAAVALREIVERRFVLVAAAVVAIFPILVPFLEKASGPEIGEERRLVALFVSVGFGLATGLLVGASVVGRELAEKRLSFYFSRPLPGVVVWGGKVAGGLALTLLVEAIILLPSGLAAGRVPALTGGAEGAWQTALLLLLPFPFFFVAWAGSVALRSGSPWLAVDLVALPFLAGAAWTIGSRFDRYGGQLREWDTALGGGFVLLVLVAASLWQVVAGRTDARRGHGALSLVLWSGLTAGVVAAGLLAWRTVDPGVRNLAFTYGVQATGDPDSTLVWGRGSERARATALYLVDLRTRRERLLPRTWLVAVAADGKRVVWVEESVRDRHRVASVRTVAGPGAEEVELSNGEPPLRLALSADGQRVAVLGTRTLSVTDLPSDRLLASVHVPGDGRFMYDLRYVSPGTVRLVPFARSERPRPGEPIPPIPGGAPILELDVASHRLSETGRIALLESSARLWPILSADASRAIVFPLEPEGPACLLDARTGAPVGGESPDLATATSATFLADGSIVTAGGNDARPVLRLLARDGSLVREVSLPEGKASVRIGAEITPGVVAVSVGKGSVERGQPSFLVDLSTGSVRDLGGVVSVAWGARHPAAVPAGSLFARLFREIRTGRLVLVDPVTLARTPLPTGAASKIGG